MVILSQLASVEFVSALSRRLRESQISENDFIELRGVFLTDKDDFYISIDLDESVLIRARQLVAKHPLRALDALQLASALEAVQLFEIKPVFISADVRLLEAAAAEGLPTDDPNAHP